MGTPTFSLLYEKLCNAVILANRAIQEAIFCYYQFGKALIQRQGEIASEKQVDPESNTVSRILNIKVKAQLPIHQEFKHGIIFRKFTDFHNIM
jgi:hypothetical protein